MKLAVLCPYFVKTAHSLGLVHKTGTGGSLIGKFFSPQNWIGNSLVSNFSEKPEPKVMKKI
jgi:hypothetical protein